MAGHWARGMPFSTFMLMTARQPTPVAQARSRRSMVLMDGYSPGLANSLMRLRGWPATQLTENDSPVAISESKKALRRATLRALRRAHCQAERSLTMTD
jgi:hypothetical protein